MEDKLKVVENEDSSSDSTMEPQVMENEEEEEEKDGEMEKSQDEKSQDENPLDLSPENLELAQKILAIHLILVKILENLPDNSLINFRLVNKTWEKEATNVIMKGFRIRFRFAFDEGLSEFNDTIRKSRRFPCSYFEFFSVPLDDSNLKEFFTLHGSEIKRLELDFYGEDPSKLGHVLLQQAPNVEVLHISGNYEMRNAPTRLFPENSVLPHLKSLRYRNFPSASEIIRVSPKLKQVYIEDYSLNGVETLASMNKIHLLKDVLVTNDPENIVLVEYLADGHSKIEEIYFHPLSNDYKSSSDFLKRRFAKALSGILDSSQETITSVDLWLHEVFLVGVKWPRLEKVWKLSLSTFSKDLPIPANFFSDVFPNIQRLEILAISLPRLFTFTSQQRLMNLTECVVWGEKCHMLLEKLAVVAPNLTKLELTLNNKFHDLADSLWMFSGLKELRVQFEDPRLSFPQLDMDFTGLSEEMVRKLHGDPEYFKEMKLKKNEILRIRRSFFNCSELAVLKIRFRNEIDCPNFMTSVSGEFGFQMLENLHVEIEANESTLANLHSLKPYASLCK